MYEEEMKTRPSKKWQWRRFSIVVITVLCALCGFFAISYFSSLDALNKLKQTQAQSPQKEVTELVQKISEHMVLPDEKPTIATVEDTKKLAQQSFFKAARNGDKVLMFVKSKKAILYRPAQNKVIEVAYLNLKEKKQ